MSVRISFRSGLLTAVLFFINAVCIKGFYYTNEEYLGQTPPDSIPVKFAPNVLPRPSAAITFTPDGRECFFNHWSTSSAIMTTKYISSSWPPPSVVFFSGQYLDMEPHISPDGSKLLFGSMRPLAGADSTVLHCWYSEKTETGWTDPQSMPAPLRDIFIMYPSLAGNGNLYFTSSMTGNISVSKFVGGRYLQPELLSDSVNFGQMVGHPFIAPDESYLIFDAARRVINGASISDLYISYRKTDGSWTKAQNLGSRFNTENGIENCPFVSRDGKYFFFCRDGYINWSDASFIKKMNPVKKSDHHSSQQPTGALILNNYPNPFNPSTTITFTLPQSGCAKLEIFNSLGESVALPVNGEISGGLHSIKWDARSADGSTLPSGIYFVLLSAGRLTASKKLLFLK